jgi:hypothetical protein
VSETSGAAEHVGANDVDSTDVHRVLTDALLASLPRAGPQEANEAAPELIALFRLALPYDETFPTDFFERIEGFSIAFSVPGDLRLPEVRSRGRDRGIAAPCMAVPKTSVYQHHLPARRESEVWRAGEIASMQTEAIPHSVRCSAHSELWLRIFSPNTPHQRAALQRRQYIDHPRLLPPLLSLSHHRQISKAFYCPANRVLDGRVRS